MTTIYVPHLIETAAQAEALPIGTIAILRDGTRIRQTLTRADSLLGPWEMDMRGYRHALVIGFTALVPIEAEEELQRTYATTASTFPGLRWPEQHDAWKRRLVTPWEEA